MSEESPEQDRHHGDAEARDAGPFKLIPSCHFENIYQGGGPRGRRPPEQVVCGSPRPASTAAAAPRVLA